MRVCMAGEGIGSDLGAGGSGNGAGGGEMEYDGRQAAKRTYRNIFGFPINLALIAGETTAPHAQPAPCLGRKRKIDKLTAWENQRPKQRATSGHASRLESRSGTLGTYIV